MNIIFLDIDGVLNTSIFLTKKSTGEIPKTDPVDGIFGRHNNSIDDSLLLNLQKAVEETNSKLVISSTWRNGKDIDYFIRIFKLHGWQDPPVIGLIPNHYTGIRGIEIKQWINDNRKLVSQYLIIDDSVDMLPSQILGGRFIRVNHKLGFSQEDAIEVINRFNSFNKGVKSKLNHDQVISIMSSSTQKRVRKAIENELT